jgi:signal transduction histidine kinase
MTSKPSLPDSVTRQPAELVKIIDELAETNRRLLNKENELLRKQQLGQVFNEIVTTLNANRDIRDILNEVVVKITEATDSPIGVIYLFSANESELIPAASADMLDSLPSFHRSEGLFGYALKEKRQIVTGDIPDNFPFKIRKTDDMEVSPRAIIVQPLSSGSKDVGVFLGGTLANYRSDALDLINRLAFHIAEAVLKAITLQKTISLARELKFKTDALKKKYVELEKAHQLKSAILAGVSHELKTPLNAIIGFSRVLLNQKSGALNDKQEEFARYILKNGEHLLSVINDILDLSRIESGRLEFSRRKLNIFDLIEDCVRSIRSLLESKAQEIHVTCGESLPIIRADRNKLKQIIFNLLSNAVKFSPDGSRIEIVVQLTEYGDEVKISVTDQAPAIPSEERDKIFEPFVRGTSDSHQEGTGLGLPLARKLVEGHGGQLWLEPFHGRGNTFSFTLPVAGPGPRADRNRIVKMRFDGYE